MPFAPAPRGFLPAFVTLNALVGTSIGLAKVTTSLYRSRAALAVSEIP